MNENLGQIQKHLRRIFRMALMVASFLLIALLTKFGVVPVELISEKPETENKSMAEIPAEMIGQIDAESGLVIDVGYDVVKAQCGACHSTSLVAQNSFSREGWLDLIRWMQREQKLWDLGENEIVILDYLEKHRSPKKQGRRKNLGEIEWYALNE